MKFTLSWLKDHLETTASLAEITTKLTAVGLEVESVEDPGKGLEQFVVAHVVEAKQHPNADRLRVCTVNSGTETLQVVCGAPNARTGLKVVLARPGAVIPISGDVLKKGKIRDVESQGMLCSYRELKLGEDHAGIIELPEDAPIGAPVTQVLKIDPVIEINLTPNRVDALGVYGVARDLAAAGVGKLKPLHAAHVPGHKASSRKVKMSLPAGQEHKCPQFVGRTIRGVKNGESPAWLKDRLQAIGLRPVSVLVDITQYLTIDLGRPLHAFDDAKLAGDIGARLARNGEQVAALNGKTYTLDSSMTVIADDSMVHDIGGIMGGEHSGVSETTTDVLIECAYFDPEHIARTGQKLALTSDARQRFERGVDPAFLEDGLAIATKLVLDHCGGTPSAITRAGAAPVAPRNISYDTQYCQQLGGVDVAPDEQRNILERLGFSVSDDWRVTVPTWRRDVDGPADIVEEVVRIVGLDNVVSVPLPRADGVAKPTATPVQSLERKVRRAAAARGLNEAINWSFLPQKAADAFGGGTWSLANPISEDMKVMRPSLLPGLLSAAQRNMDRGASSVRLFEIGRRYFAAADGTSDERLTAGIVLAGDKSVRNWATGKSAKFDAFDAKAEAIALLKAAGVATDGLLVMDDAGAHYHPGQSATLRMGPKNILGAFGTLHPATAKAFDLDGSVVAAEIFLDAIPLKKATGFMRPAFTPPALQAVTRDFAFLVAQDTPANDLVRAIKGCDKDNIVAARLFDRFAGQGVPEGQVSLAVEITLQPTDKSYGDDDLKLISDKVIAAAAKLGAVLRG